MRTKRLGGLGILALLILGTWGWNSGYRVNTTPSLPKGIYRLVPGVPVKGDLVTFCLEGEYAALAKERGYLGAGLCPSGLRPLLKRLAGVPGDASTLGSQVPRLFDSQNRPVPSMLQPGVIPSGLALVLADHPGSFDSRYFGLVPLSSLHRVEPVFTFNSKGE